jgi:hypothetical protein
MEGDTTFVREEALEEQEGNALRASVNEHTTFLSTPAIFTPIFIQTWQQNRTAHE